PAPRGHVGREARAAGRSRGEEDRGVRAERAGLGRRPPGPDAAGPRARLRPDGREHLPRRPEPRPALLHAPGGRLGALPDAGARALPVRGRGASRRRGHGRARLQRGETGAAGPAGRIAMVKKGILERLAEGPVLGDGGYLLELEKRGWVRAGPF